MIDTLKYYITDYGYDVFISGLAGILLGYIVSAVSGNRKLGKLSGVIAAIIVLILIV